MWLVYLMLSSQRSNLRRTNRGPGLNFKELIHGRIKMMTALCLAKAYTYQIMCLRLHPEQLRHDAFRLTKPKKKFTMLSCRRTTTKMSGIESLGWRVFTDGGSNHQIDCPNPLRPSFVGFPGGGFQRSRHAATRPRSSLVLRKPWGGLISSLVVNVGASFSIPNTRPVSRLVLPTQKKTLRLPRDVTSSCCI